MKTVIEMALEALEVVEPHTFPDSDAERISRAAIIACQEALASPEQKPMAYGMWDTMLGKDNRMMMVRLDKGQDGCTVPLYTSPPAEPDFWEGYVPEPVKPAQQALDKMAENARELGLDYEPSSVSKLAREAGIRDCTCNGTLGCLERFAELVRADERNSWPAEMEAMERQVNILTDALAESRREIDALVSLARADEREACAKVCDDLVPPCGYNLTETSFWDVTSLECAAAIRARGNT